MSRTTNADDGASRLARIADEFDAIVRADRHRLQAKVTFAVGRYLDLYQQDLAERKRRASVKREAVIAQLKAGCIQAALKPGDRSDVVFVKGWFPGWALAEMQPDSVTATRLRVRHEKSVARAVAKKRPTPDPPKLPQRVQAALASAALPLVEHSHRLQADPTLGPLPDKRPRRGWLQSEVIVRYVVQPDCVAILTPPDSQDRDYLRQLPAIDMLAICYARLAALRDCRVLDQLYDWRLANEDCGRGEIDHLVRQTQLDHLIPLARDQSNSPTPVLDPALFDPHLAENMLKIVKDDLAPGQLFVDESGALRQLGEVDLPQYLKAIHRQLHLFLAHVELGDRSSGYDHVLKPGGPSGAAQALWDRVAALVGLTRGRAVIAANPPTPEQRAKLQATGVLAQGPLSPHPNFMPIDAVLAELQFTRPIEARDAGVTVVDATKVARLRRLAELLAMHAGDKPVSVPETVWDGRTAQGVEQPEQTDIPVDEPVGEPGREALINKRWLTVKEAHTLTGLPKHAITRLANSKRLKSNGAKYRKRRIDSASLIELKLAIAKDETLRALRRWLK